MKKELTGPGCLSIIGAGFAVLAVLFLVAGLHQSAEAGAAFLPFVGCVFAAVLCFAVVDLRRRVGRIEEHLGIRREDEDLNRASDSHEE